MKSIDFSKPGGFPLTQDQLDYLQISYNECLGALGNAPGNGVPVILQGMAVTSTFITTTIGNGWLFYNGEIIRFAASTFSSALGMGFELFVTIATTSGTLLFNDGSTPGVINESVATVQFLPSTTPDGPTCFRYSSLLSYGKALGAAYRESVWKHVVVNTGAGHGSISGDVYYKKDIIANTLHLRGLVGTATPGDFAAWPLTTSISIGTLQVGYRPATAVPFTVQPPLATYMLRDDNGTYFSRLNATLETNGKLYIDWVLPDSAFSVYALQFNVILPLD
jgi:hypothetical protein